MKRTINVEFYQPIGDGESFDYVCELELGKDVVFTGRTKRNKGIKTRLLEVKVLKVREGCRYKNWIREDSITIQEFDKDLLL